MMEHWFQPVGRDQSLLRYRRALDSPKAAEIKERYAIEESLAYKRLQKEYNRASLLSQESDALRQKLLDTSKEIAARMYGEIVEACLSGTASP